MAELTLNQDNFAKGVAVGKTYAEAYRIAYPKAKKWKNESVWVESSKLMSNTKVLLRVKELRTPADDVTKLTIKDILNKIKYWVEFDPIVFYNDEGVFKPMSEIPEKDRRCLDDIVIKETWADGKKTGRIVSIKTPDKKGTMDMVNKMLGAYVKDNMQKGSGELPEQMKEIIKEIDS